MTIMTTMQMTIKIMIMMIIITTMIYGCIDADDHDDNLTDDDDSYVLMIDDDNIKVSKSTLSAKWNDYERVKILLRYGYRLKR